MALIDLNQWVTGSIPVVQPNRVFFCQVQIGRLCRDFRYRFGALSSLREFVVSGGDFGGPVSASKNSVPGGQGSASRAAICAASVTDPETISSNQRLPRAMALINRRRRSGRSGRTSFREAP